MQKQQGGAGKSSSDAVPRPPTALQHPKIAKFYGVSRSTAPQTTRSSVLFRIFASSKANEVLPVFGHFLCYDIIMKIYRVLWRNAWRHWMIGPRPPESYNPDKNWQNMTPGMTARTAVSATPWEKWICMGTWAFEIWAALFLKNEKAPDDRAFLAYVVWALLTVVLHILKRFHRERSSRDKETIHILLAKLSIFVKITIIRPRTPRFWPGQSSLAPPILVCWCFQGMFDPSDNKDHHWWIWGFRCSQGGHQQPVQPPRLHRTISWQFQADQPWQRL